MQEPHAHEAEELSLKVGVTQRLFAELPDTWHFLRRWQSSEFAQVGRTATLLRSTIREPRKSSRLALLIGRSQLCQCIVRLHIRSGGVALR